MPGDQIFYLIKTIESSTAAIYYNNSEFGLLNSGYFNGYKL